MNLLACDSLTLADKLRNEDPEQFYTLVKMHLSFVLDLNMDESDINADKKFRSLKWNLPFARKTKSYSKTGSEGSQLNTEFIEQMRHLINFLSIEENISQEGIFRRSGKVTRQQELKSLISQGIDINLNNSQFSVHDCATVLKNILSELPESVLTDAHYPAYCQIADLCNIKNVNNEEKLLKSLQLLILLLPTENRIFFQDIIVLLNLAASHEDKNRMSADNLATLFTPHLLCPRKLSPEALHTNSQLMSCVVAFMIKKGLQLFEIPITLATDLQAYWNKKERRKLSPLKQMNESVCDGTAANTVFTFVDRERTAQENGANPTETALAQLYAYIQSLPESSKKRKLIKQFNKENGYGTPLRAMGGKKRARSRSLGDSIKRHLPAFTKNVKRNTQGSNFGEDLNRANIGNAASTTQPMVDRGFDEKYKENIPVLEQNLLTHKVNGDKSIDNETDDKNFCEIDDATPLRNNILTSQRCLTFDIFKTEESEKEDFCIPQYKNSSPDGPVANRVLMERRNNSTAEISSTCNVKSETVLDHLRVTHDDVRQWPVSKQILPAKEKIGELCDAIQSNIIQKPDCLTRSSNLAINTMPHPLLNSSYKTPCKTASLRHMDSQGFVEPPVFDNVMKTPRKFSTNGNLPLYFNNEFFISSPNTTNRVSTRYCSKSHLLVTSTPAAGNGCIVTPIVDKNNSMSPITRSTQKMPKAMQETMMTPRSRKPVISLSGTDLCNLANVDSLSGNCSIDDLLATKADTERDYQKLMLEDTNERTSTDSLSSTFRDYLFSRSVLTTTPADLSFSSRTDDFLSLSENSSVENEEFKSLSGSILNDDALSESLLYCLDGNQPSSNDNSDFDHYESKMLNGGSSHNEHSICHDEVNRVHETAL